MLGSPSARLEALGWLRNQVVSRGFKVAILGSSGSPIAELEKIAAGISPGDVVLVHVSARLATSDSIALSPTTSLPLSALTEHLAARSPGHVSVILDLVRGDDLGDEAEAPDLPSELARSLGAEERGYCVLAAVRALTDDADRIAFTRRTMPPFDEAGPPSCGALLSAMHERAVASDSGEGERSFVLLPGAPDATIDGLVTEAMQAGDWRRVVELRLDRAETLATVAQRAQELAGVARILQVELRDPDGAIDVLEHARTLDPKRATVLEALRYAYEASGRAPPIDPAEYVKAFAAHRRAGQVDAALLDAMLLEELGAAEPEHLAMVEQSRSVGAMQALKPLDAAAWDALRAPGFDETVASLLTGVRDTAVAARLELPSSRRVRALDPAARLDAESTVTAVRTLNWAARVLGVDCPDLYAGTDDAGEAITHVPSDPPAITLAPRVLSGMSAKALAFLAGRTLTWYRPEYHSMLYYRTLEDLRELVGASLDAGGEVALQHWIRSAELTAARAGLLLCGELKTAVAGVRSQSSAPGRPSAERVTSDLVAFCASRAHTALRAQFLRLPSQSVAPPSRG
jgi:hypothetical protein